jgi:hypothetical protein
MELGNITGSCRSLQSSLAAANVESCNRQAALPAFSECTSYVGCFCPVDIAQGLADYFRTGTRFDSILLLIAASYFWTELRITG